MDECSGYDLVKRSNLILIYVVKSVLMKLYPTDYYDIFGYFHKLEVSQPGIMYHFISGILKSEKTQLNINQLITKMVFHYNENFVIDLDSGLCNLQQRCNTLIKSLAQIGMVTSDIKIVHNVARDIRLNLKKLMELMKEINIFVNKKYNRKDIQKRLTSTCQDLYDQSKEFTFALEEYTSKRDSNFLIAKGLNLVYQVNQVLLEYQEVTSELITK